MAVTPVLACSPASGGSLVRPPPFSAHPIPSPKQSQIPIFYGLRFDLLMSSRPPRRDESPLFGTFHAMESTFVPLGAQGECLAQSPQRSRRVPLIGNGNCPQAIIPHGNHPLPSRENRRFLLAPQHFSRHGTRIQVLGEGVSSCSPYRHISFDMRTGGTAVLKQRNEEDIKSLPMPHVGQNGRLPELPLRLNPNCPRQAKCEACIPPNGGAIG